MNASPIDPSKVRRRFVCETSRDFPFVVDAVVDIGSVNQALSL